MTYGWAILIVVIVAGVLAYYGVFSPKVTASTGFGDVSVVKPWNLKASGDLVLQMQNKVGQDIKITRVFANDGVFDACSSGREVTGSSVVGESVIRAMPIPINAVASATVAISNVFSRPRFVR